MSLPRQPAAVVFDMDGLLFDTESIYERAAISAAAELGREMDSAFFRSTVGSPWTAIRERRPGCVSGWHDDDHDSGSLAGDGRNSRSVYARPH